MYISIYRYGMYTNKNNWLPHGRPMKSSGMARSCFARLPNPRRWFLLKAVGWRLRQLWTIRDHQGTNMYQLSVSEKVWPQVIQLVFELVVINYLAHAKKKINVFSRENPPFLGISRGMCRRRRPPTQKLQDGQPSAFWAVAVEYAEAVNELLEGENLQDSIHCFSKFEYIGVSTSPFKDGQIINNNMVTSQARLWLAAPARMGLLKSWVKVLAVYPL